MGTRRRESIKRPSASESVPASTPDAKVEAWLVHSLEAHPRFFVYIGSSVVLLSLIGVLVCVFAAKALKDLGQGVLVLWVFIMAGVIIGVTVATLVLPKRHWARIVLRSLAWCLALSPTFVLVGFVGFPAPASMIIAASMLWPEWLERWTGGNLVFAVFMLLGTSVVTLYTRLRRRKRNAT
jgi:hypothetical protein